MIAHSRPGEFLYHYTSIDKALLIVQSGKLWLNKINGVNDPKEFSDWNLNCRTNGLSITCAEWDALNLEISNECKSMTKLACFTQDSITEYQDGPERYCQFGCIGRGFANSPMWHFYGDSHKGCCLIFNKNALIQNLVTQASASACFHGDVKYVVEELARDIGFEPYCFDLDRLISNGVKNYCNDFLRENMRELYFKKHDVWQCENEYRFIALSAQDEPFKLDIGKSLKHICFGVKCERVDEVKSIFRTHGLSCHRIKFQNHTIHYDWTKV